MAWISGESLLSSPAGKWLMRGMPASVLEGVAPEQPARDDQALDLVRALADQEQRVVAVEALDLELLRVAVAAVDAHRLLDAALRDLGREQLRHAGLDVGAAPRVLLACGGRDQVLGGLDAGRHVGELGLDQLVLGDRLAECTALLGVADGELVGAQ